MPCAARATRYLTRDRHAVQRRPSERPVPGRGPHPRPRRSPRRHHARGHRARPDRVRRAHGVRTDKEKERMRMATHEAGHFLCSLCCPHHPPPERITIRSEMPWLGHFTAFQKDETSAARHDAQSDAGRPVRADGGIEAERLLLHDISTGATGGAPHKRLGPRRGDVAGDRDGRSVRHGRPLDRACACSAMQRGSARSSPASRPRCSIERSTASSPRAERGRLAWSSNTATTSKPWPRNSGRRRLSRGGAFRRSSRTFAMRHPEALELFRIRDEAKTTEGLRPPRPSGTRTIRCALRR